MKKPETAELQSGKTTTTETEQLTIDGLATSIVQLRKELKEDRLSRAEWMSATKTDLARMRESVLACHARVDAFAEQWMESRNEMQQARQQAGEELRAAGRMARDMTDRATALEEIRRNTPDPAVYLKPVREAVAQLRADVLALSRATDVRFEGLPQRRPRPPEERGDSPNVGNKPAR